MLSPFLLLMLLVSSFTLYGEAGDNEVVLPQKKCPPLPGICYWYSGKDIPCPYEPSALQTQQDQPQKQIRELKKNQAGWQVSVSISPDLFWEDGHNVTAEDFVLGWHMIRKKKWFRNTRPYDQIRKVQAINNNVVITYARPTYDFLGLSNLRPVPSGVSTQATCRVTPAVAIPNEKTPPAEHWVLMVNQRHPHWKHKSNRQKLSQILSAGEHLKPYTDLFDEEAKASPSKTLQTKDMPTADATPLEFIYKSTGKSPAMATRIMQTLEEQNIRVKPKIVKDSEQLQQTLQGMTHQGLVLAQVQFPFGNSLRHLMHSQRIPSQVNQYQGGNFGAFQDSRTDEIIETLDKTTSIKKRRRLEQRLTARMQEMVPFWLVL